MKKIISLILALVMVMSLSTAAFAEGIEDGDNDVVFPGSEPATEETSFNFGKSYVTTAGNTPAVFPAEVLEFTVTAKAGNPDGTMITIADHTVAGNPDNVVITVPSYDKVGKWNYTVSEVEGGTQGVTYSDTTFDVQVVVTWNEDHTDLVATTAFTTKDGTTIEGRPGKVDEIVNTYDLGSLNIKKTVSGDLASETQKFDIDVTFTSDKPVKSAVSGPVNIAVNEWQFNEATQKWEVNKTVTVSLAHNDTDGATFTNIPAGIDYIVNEQAKHAAPDANGSDASKGYEVSYDDDQSGKIAADGEHATIVNNDKGASVDTGIVLDSMPYILLMAIAVAGIALLLTKKRSHEN